MYQKLTLLECPRGAAPNLMSELQSVAAGQASVLNSLAEDFPERELHCAVRYISFHSRVKSSNRTCLDPCPAVHTIQSEVANSQINTATLESQFEDLATDSSFQAVVQAE